MTRFTYEFITIPLGRCDWYSEDNVRYLKIPIYMLTSLEVDGDVSAQQIREAIDLCPFWHPHVSTFTSEVTISNSKVLASGSWDNDPASEITREHLKDYLVGTEDRAFLQGGSRSAHKAKADDRFDKLQSDQLCDSPATYAGSIPHRDFLAYGVSAGLMARLAFPGSGNFNLDTLNTRVLRTANAMVMDSAIRWLNNDNSASSSYNALQKLLNQQFGRQHLVDTLYGSMNSLRAGLGTLADRVHGYQKGDARTLDDPNPSIGEKELCDYINQREPNTLLRLAAKDPVLAKHLGLLKKGFVLVKVNELPADRCEIRLSFKASTNHDVALNSKPTVFYANDIAYPAPFNPELGPTGALSWLNGRADGKDYRALQVDADGELIKGWVLQSSNTLKTTQKMRMTSAGITDVETPRTALEIDRPSMNVDAPLKSPKEQDRIRGDAAEHLAAETAGINQPETKGITFSASPLDLITNSHKTYGADARRKEGKYYLEDLWIGYRIDVSSRENGVIHPFRSLNLERIEFTMPGLGWRIAPQVSESFFEREQLCVDRPTGSEITTWTGLAECQTNPLAGRRVNCLPSESGGGNNYNHGQNLDPTIDLTGKHVTTVDGEHPRLYYDLQGLWRIRNVFCGGISVTIEEADHFLGASDSMKWHDHTQQLTFLRSEAYGPGELVNPDAADSDGEQTLYLLEDNSHKNIYLVPRPLALSELRFGNYVGERDDEPERYRDVALTRNVRRLLLDPRGHIRSNRYFADKAVHEVVVRTQLVNRNPDNKPLNRVVSDVECEIVLPYTLSPFKLTFGEPENWLKYRPIKLEFHAVRDGNPQSRRISYFGCETARFDVPPGDILEISIVPSITSTQVRNSFFYQNVQLGDIAATSGEGLQALKGIPPLPMFPIISERRLRVIHTTRRPRQAPVLTMDPRGLKREMIGLSPNRLIYSLPRSAKDNRAFLVGQTRVDAATTGQIYLDVSWTEISDVVEQPAYVVIDGHFLGTPRNILLQQAPELLPEKALNIAISGSTAKESARAIADELEHMRVENIIHLVKPNHDNDAQSQCNAIDFKSAARRIATVVVHARSRYRNKYPPGEDAEYESISNSVIVEAPNQMVPPEVRVAHVLPTFPMIDESKGGTQRVGAMGLRVFIERPWFLTGVGERCAIGCLFRAEDTTSEYGIATKYSTLWGEDVFEMPRLQETLRVPRATDFISPSLDDGQNLDSILYPSISADERSVLSYYDNVQIRVKQDEMTTSNPAASELRGLSLASYALRYDRQQKRYYFDILVGGSFFGWLKLALYRHQPGSINGYEISRTPAFVYAAILNDTPCVQYAEQDWWVLRIGPCFDRTVSYRAGYAEDVGPGVVAPLSDIKEFSQQIIDGQRFFTLRVEYTKRANLTVYQLRKGAVQSAFRA